MKAHIEIDGRFVLRGVYELPERVVEHLESGKWDGDYLENMIGDALPLHDIRIYDVGLEEIKALAGKEE